MRRGGNVFLQFAPRVCTGSGPPLVRILTDRLRTTLGPSPDHPRTESMQRAVVQVVEGSGKRVCKGMIFCGSDTIKWCVRR